MTHTELLEAKRSLENISLLTKEESRSLSKALVKLRAGQPLSASEQASCEQAIKLSEAMFCD